VFDKAAGVAGHRILVELPLINKGSATRVPERRLFRASRMPGPVRKAVGQEGSYNAGKLLCPMHWIDRAVIADGDLENAVLTCFLGKRQLMATLNADVHVKQQSLSLWRTHG
jgi:hypothetical protein